jgi:BNR repeat-like domain
MIILLGGKLTRLEILGTYLWAPTLAEHELDLESTAKPNLLTVFCINLFVLSFLIGFLTFSAAAQVSSSDQPIANIKVFVDPDLRVSYDGDVVHMEAYIGASSTNPDLLVAGAELIVPGRRLDASEARLYLSTDAGARWNPLPLPDEVNGGWDNAVTGGIGDSAFFLTSNFDRGLTVYHTSDGGKTWASTVLAAAAGWDRPHVAVDATTSPYRGRFYVSGEADDGVRVIASSDDGKTFSSPVTACAHAVGWNAATAASPMILSDGTLVVPCAPYPNDPARATWTAADVGIVTSSDGGRTFTPYHKIAITHRVSTREMYAARVRGDILLSGNFMQGPSFAVAPRGTKFSDRLYAAWQDIDSEGGSRVVLAWSADRGATWTTPLSLDSSRAPDARSSAVRQGVPMVAVNHDGVLGVAWFDGRGASDDKGYDVFFSSSSDGGRTFLPSVRVSTATSRPERGLNIVPAFDVAPGSANRDVVIHAMSPFSERATGADYSSMAVDADGRFHPLWIDARDGAWQLYTATVRVLMGDAPAELAARLTPQQNPRVGPCTLDSNQIQLLFGEAKWNGAASEVVVPVRLLNNSADPFVNAISVRAALDTGEEEWSKFVSDATALRPKVFDATRASFGDYATFEYPISTDSPLFPHGVTLPLDWRIHVPVPTS